MSNTRRPNILLLLPDQWRPDWTGLPDGVGIRTPTLVELARGGARFTRAFCASPLCAPSRAILASGRAYHRAGVASNDENYPLHQPTMYELLRDAGYAVMGCGKFDLHKPDHTWGLDGTHLIREWGFTAGIDSEGKLDGINAYAEGTPGPYLRYLASEGVADAYVSDMNRRKGNLEQDAVPGPLGDEQYGDNWVARNASSLLRGAPGDRPWFLQVNFAGPHSPFDITESLAELYADEAMPPADGCTRPAPLVRSVRRAYSAMCENIDRASGEILSSVEARGELENTLVVFSSDHGEMLGDRDRWGKVLPYNPSLGVPLVIAGPAVKRSVIQAVTSTLDLTATILEAAGVPVPDAMDSISLLPALAGSAPPRRHVTAALTTRKRAWRAVLDDEYKLIENADGSTELYRYHDDQHERENLAQQPGSRHAAAQARLRALLPPDRPEHKETV